MPRPRGCSTRNVRKVKSVLHIFCEGAKTEPNYIQGYINDLSDLELRKVIKIEDCKKNTPIELVESAVNFKKDRNTFERDEVWVVYDRESVEKYPDERHDKAWKHAKDNGVNIALNNVCFEQWLLLHLCDSDASYRSYDDLINNSQFRRSFKDKYKVDYTKGNHNIYKLVKESIAEARSRAVAMNQRLLRAAAQGRTRPHHIKPYTDMPRLLDAIDAFKS